MPAAILCVAAAVVLGGWRWPAPAALRPPADLVLPARLPHRLLAVPILMYHRIGPIVRSAPAITEALTVTPAVFDAQMRWLRGDGFHAITQLQLFDALEHGARLPPSPVLITFDDGYRDVLWNAAPLLHRLRMPATAYVITGRIDDGDPSFLSWPLEASRRALQRQLRTPVQWFAYPAGAADAAVAELVRRAGYVLAVTTRPGDVQSAAEPFLLHRDEILDTTGLHGLEALLGR